MGKLHENLHEPVKIESDRDRLSLADLIRQTVDSQVRQKISAEANEEDAIDDINLGYLTQSEVDRYEQEGKISTTMVHNRSHKLSASDIPMYQEYALMCFERGTYAVLVDGNQITELDEEISLPDAENLVFLRIVPFVGG